MSDAVLHVHLIVIGDAVGVVPLKLGTVPLIIWIFPAIRFVEGGALYFHSSVIRGIRIIIIHFQSDIRCSKRDSKITWRNKMHTIIRILPVSFRRSDLVHRNPFSTGDSLQFSIDIFRLVAVDVRTRLYNIIRII